MVMERIAAPTLSDCDISEESAVEYAASAMKWLLNQFFKDHQPPRAFSNGNELLTNIFRASEICRPGARLSPDIEEALSASFKETRCIYYSDINAVNFLLDSNNKVWIIRNSRPLPFSMSVSALPQVLAEQLGINLKKRRTPWYQLQTYYGSVEELPTW